MLSGIVILVILHRGGVGQLPLGAAVHVLDHLVDDGLGAPHFQVDGSLYIIALHHLIIKVKSISSILSVYVGVVDVVLVLVEDGAEGADDAGGPYGNGVPVVSKYVQHSQGPVLGAAGPQALLSVAEIQVGGQGGDWQVGGHLVALLPGEVGDGPGHGTVVGGGFEGLLGLPVPVQVEGGPAFLLVLAIVAGAQGAVRTAEALPALVAVVTQRDIDAVSAEVGGVEQGGVA